MGRNRTAPPHLRIRNEKTWRERHESHVAALEAQYGVPYEKIPSVLREVAPTHPQHEQARRFGYLTRTAYNFNYRARRGRRRLMSESGRGGWREDRAGYLRALERRREAEVEVRKLRYKRGGRGKVPPKNVREQALKAVERRELREGAW